MEENAPEKPGEILGGFSMLACPNLYAGELVAFSYADKKQLDN